MSNRDVRHAFQKWLLVTTILWTAVITPNVAFPQQHGFTILSIVLLVAGCLWTMAFGSHLTHHGRPNRILWCSLWASLFLAFWSIFLIVVSSETPGVLWSLGFHLLAVGAMWLLGFGVLAAFMVVGSNFVLGVFSRTTSSHLELTSTESGPVGGSEPAGEQESSTDEEF